MLIQQFSSLNENEQEKTIWKFGILLANYDEGNMTSDVYKVFNFYTSVSFDMGDTLRSHISSNVIRTQLLLFRNSAA